MRGHAEHGDLVLIEGWELAGLDEIFGDDESDKIYWWKRVSLSNWPLLGCECSFLPSASLKLAETAGMTPQLALASTDQSFERLLATLEHGKLTDLASFNLLPTGIQRYVATCMQQTLRDSECFCF